MADWSKKGREPMEDGVRLSMEEDVKLGIPASGSEARMEDHCEAEEASQRRALRDVRGMVGVAVSVVKSQS